MEGLSDITRILKAAEQGDPIDVGEAMRRILIDRARRKRAMRHGGGRQRADI